MEQGYERIEVVGRGQKNSAVDTKHAVRNRVSLRSIMFGSPQDQIKSEQQTQETERLALLGTMAAVFAHEVGNPLTEILLSLKCVESQLEKQDVDYPYLLSMIRGAVGEIDRLRLLLNEFRSLAPEKLSTSSAPIL